MSGAVLGVVTAGAAVAGGLVTKMVENWLGARSKVTEELRDDRLRVYPLVWEQTKVFSNWPWTNATYKDVESLHDWLRVWYFETGGLYLSEYARRRYGDMQELIELHLDSRPPQAATTQLAEDVYTDLMTSCSAFRTSLTEDLESRRPRSFLWLLQKRREHRTADRAATKRKKQVPEHESNHSVRVNLEERAAPPWLR